VSSFFGREYVASTSVRIGDEVEVSHIDVWGRRLTGVVVSEPYDNLDYEYVYVCGYICNSMYMDILMVKGLRVLGRRIGGFEARRIVADLRARGFDDHALTVETEFEFGFGF
jgi:hypothetical protein